MANYTVGGEAISVSLKVYSRIKRAWKYIGPGQGTTDFVNANDAMIGAMAVGLDTPFTGEPTGDKDAIEAFRIAYIGDHLTADELKGLPTLMNAVLVESGLAGAADTPASDSPEAALAA